MVEKPWRALRERPNIEFGLCDLPAGLRAVYVTEGPYAAILIDRKLSPVERLAALAHELVHAERGHVCVDPSAPPELRVLTRREEHRVHGIVADWLVDPDELQRFVDQRTSLGEGTRAIDVADEFEVPAHVAYTALERLASGF